MKLPLTDHAQHRCAQRNLSSDEIDYIFRHGEKSHRAQVRHYRLRRCDVPEEDRSNQRISQIVGSVVVVGRYGKCVITAYRDGDRSWKNNRRKPKYGRVA